MMVWNWQTENQILNLKLSSNNLITGFSRKTDNGLYTDMSEIYFMNWLICEGGWKVSPLAVYNLEIQESSWCKSDWVQNWRTRRVAGITCSPGQRHKNQEVADFHTGVWKPRNWKLPCLTTGKNGCPSSRENCPSFPFPSGLDDAWTHWCGQIFSTQSTESNTDLLGKTRQRYIQK